MSRMSISIRRSPLCLSIRISGRPVSGTARQPIRRTLDSGLARGRRAPTGTRRGSPPVRGGPRPPRRGPERSAPCVQKENRSIEPSRPWTTLSLCGVGRGSRGWCAARRRSSRDRRSGGSRARRRARPRSGSPGRKACDVTPRDCRNRTSQPKAWQPIHRAAATAKTDEDRHGDRDRRLEEPRQAAASARPLASIWASVRRWPRFAIFSADRRPPVRLREDELGDEERRQPRSDASGSEPRRAARAIAANVRTGETRRPDEPPEGGVGVAVPQGPPRRLRSSRSSGSRRGVSSPSAFSTKAARDSTVAGGAHVRRSPSILTSLPVEDVGDRVVVRGDGLAIDDEGVQLTATARRRAGLELRDLERGRHAVVVLLAGGVEVALGELAAPWRRRRSAARPCRSRGARCAPRRRCSARVVVRLAFDVSRLYWATPLAPLAPAVQDRVRERRARPSSS